MKISLCISAPPPSFYCFFVNSLMEYLCEGVILFEIFYYKLYNISIFPPQYLSEILGFENKKSRIWELTPSPDTLQILTYKSFFHTISISC